MPLTKDLVHIVLQFLNDEKYTETAHMLEKESRFYFDLKYFEDLIMAGKFDEAESYLLGFTNLEDNQHSVKIFFEIRKQNYIEALDRKDRLTAMKILGEDLKVFKNISPEIYSEMVELSALDNIRKHNQLKHYEDAQSQRFAVFKEIEPVVKSHPLIRPKLMLPSIGHRRLRNLINQSLNWQHMNCKTPQPEPDIKTLLVDHTCEPSIGTPPLNNHLMGSIQTASFFRPSAMNAPFQPHFGPVARNPSEWMANPSPPLQHATVTSAPFGLVACNLSEWMAKPSPHVQQPAVTPGAAALLPRPNAVISGALLQRPRTPATRNSGIVNQLTDSEHAMKLSSVGQVRQLGPIHHHNIYSENDLPKIVVRSLNQGSDVVSMDFHPQQHTILLVGTNIGDIGIWKVGSSEKLTNRSFKDWDSSNRTMTMQAALSKQSVVSVNRCIWSPDGAFVGVAFSASIVHIYSYHETGELRQHLEIDAHIGGVNDIAFVHLQTKLYVITCGDDKNIKVWDAETGCKLCTFEGHEAPVYSVYPHQKKNVPFIFSIDVNGKIKAWLYDSPICKVNYDAPGHGCTAMAYSVDGSRFFTCGTNKEGESYLVEWDETEGIIKRKYCGFEKQSSEVVKFATSKNRFLAAGDGYQIKFWDMDNINILTKTDVEGCLQARPCLCFNKRDSLLAVTTRDNGIKILANEDGVKLLHMPENRRLTPESKAPLSNLVSPVNTIGSAPRATENSERIPPEVLTRLRDDGESKNWKFVEITDPNHCTSLRLQDPLPIGKIVRLLYTYSGSVLLALDSNAVHKQWIWPQNDQNLSVQCTTNDPPQFWQPHGGAFMINDKSDIDGEVVPCMALSKNGVYVLSASGGKVSLFNLITFKVMDNYMPPPPAATCLAFHPLDNNVIAIGLEDSTIQIYNTKLRKLDMTLKGHTTRITGLAFSEALNVLVSSGADSKLCVWDINGWEKCKSKSIHSQEGKSPSLPADTTVQFDNIDQVKLLVAQESQIAIYDASKLECVCHWAPRDPEPSRISSATYSCDSVRVYASFFDGSIGVFDSELLRPRCRIAPSAFLPSMQGSGNIYPIVIAAHPKEHNHIAVGLTDGSVHVIQCKEKSDDGDASSNHKDVESPSIEMMQE